MKTRAPRNRTLRIADHERESLLAETLTLRAPVSAETLRDRLVHQDLFDCLAYLPESFIDLLLIDPPYNLSKRFGSRRFSRTSSAEYEAWLESWLPALKRCMKPDASLYLCSDWQSSHAVQNVLQQHFIVRNRLTWEREKGRGAAANWKNCAEDIWFCTVSDDYHFDVDAVKLKRRVLAPYRDSSGMPRDWEANAAGNYRLTHPSNLWTDISVPFWSMPENTEHPTQKPEKLVAKLILASSGPGDVVFDPFFGSGTSCVVAAKLGRRFGGIEREADYCRLAAKRLQLAREDATIQGYRDGCFWERNSLAAQKKHGRDAESGD